MMLSSSSQGKELGPRGQAMTLGDPIIVQSGFKTGPLRDGGVYYFQICSIQWGAKELPGFSQPHESG